MNALVLVNGDIYRPDVLRERLRRETFDAVWGVDGGARHAAALGVRVTAVIGDLDSLPPVDLAALGGVEVLKFPAAKDETDLELALVHAVRRGAGRLVIAGALGGRLDMTLANLHLLAHPDLEGCRVEVWHGHQTARALRPPGGEVQGNPGDILSLVPLAGDAAGVTTHGLEYALRGQLLFFGAARGLSNVMTTQTARVEVTQGLLLAVHTPAGEKWRDA
jgi:thiamine pyrophosphokinase